MIANDERSVLVSSMGWVDHAELWVFDVSRNRERRVPIGSQAKYLGLRSGGAGHFSVAHYFDGPRFEVSVHAFAEPSVAIARVTIEGATREFSGDIEAWRHVPRLYVPYIKLPAFNDFTLVRLDRARQKVELERLDWYDDSYDKGYQGVISVTELPTEELAIFSVQRSSQLVLHDLIRGMKRGVVELAGRLGNPQLYFRAYAPELWASDYDTIVKVDPTTWRVAQARQLQGAAAGTQQFIGDFAFDPRESTCAVARPFSGDIVGLDPSNLKPRWAAAVGSQPLEVALLPSRKVVARDWKTGETLMGTLR